GYGHFPSPLTKRAGALFALPALLRTGPILLHGTRQSLNSNALCVHSEKPWRIDSHVRDVVHFVVAVNADVTSPGGDYARRTSRQASARRRASSTSRGDTARAKMNPR